MGKNKFKIPELLVPVGGKKQLIAAIENGADAVYLGGSLFNARINAPNFSDEELEEALSYAHARDVKIYVTMNTLIYENELFDALKYAAFLYKTGVDALIIQDTGLACLIRKYLPDFELHLSTQASVYNLEGVEMAEKLGFTRVVLARENTLEEIKKIHKNTGVELEVFIHGAICICYSGQCQFSRSIGGRSGNRGACAQPCRLKYTADGGKNYALSPKDMATIDFLPQIIEAGAASLKIEGRMKSPEYVAVVTKIYRKYLDEYSRNGEYEVSKEDRQALSQIFNRGSFTDAYFFKDNGEDFMSKRIAKHQGILIGKAISRVSETLVDVILDLGKELEIGDGVEFDNAELSGNVISYMKENKDKTLRIGDVRGKIKKGDALYKISDKMQLLQVRADLNRAESGKGTRKSYVNMQLTVELGKVAILIAESTGAWAEVFGKEEAQVAKNSPLSRERAEKQLAKLGDTPFALKAFKACIDENAIIPISELNQMRRKAVKLLVEKKSRKRNFSIENLKEEQIYDGIAEKGENKNRVLELYFHEFEENYIREAVELLDGLKLKGILDKFDELSLVISVSFLLNEDCKLKIAMLKEKIESIFGDRKDEKFLQIIPYIFPISKGKLDRYIDENFSETCKLASDGIYIGNLGMLKKFEDKIIFADYGLNVMNSLSEYCVAKFGAICTFRSHEDNNGAFGRVPLMISEHRFSSAQIMDRKNVAYEIRYLKESDKSLIYERLYIEDIIHSMLSSNQVTKNKERIYL